MLLASTAFWTQSNFGDSDRFSQLTADVIQQPEMSRQVAHALWQGLAARYLGGIDLFAEDVEPEIASALRKDSARNLVTRMASQLHASLTASRPTAWTITLGTDYPLIAGAILNINPDLLPVFPSEDQVGVITLASADEVPRLGGFADVLPWAVVLAGVIGGILAAVGVYLAEPRSTAVLAAGLTLGLGGGALLLVEFLAPGVFVNLLPDETSGQLISDALYAMTSQLRLQTGIIVVLGFVAAVAGGLARIRRPQPRPPAAPWAGRHDLPPTRPPR